MIREATIHDLERLTEIYNQAILSKKATADTETFTAEQRREWLLSHNNKRTPLLVYEDCGTVLGYCYLSEYRPGRRALESIAEISYYIDFDYHRRGIASKLIQSIIDAAIALEYRNLLAILLSCNHGSIALLEKHGFKLWGTLPDVVRIDADVYSHFYYGLNIEAKK